MMSLERGQFPVERDRPILQMTVAVTYAVIGAGVSELLSYLSCSFFPFWHLLIKGERGKIEMIFCACGWIASP
jgi:hypothetical protein